jgi:hypothetical protein
MASHVVRFPQVSDGMTSGAVARRLARSGVVGTWLGTGFRVPRARGGLISVRIESELMAAGVDGAVVAAARWSWCAAADGGGAWLRGCPGLVFAAGSGPSGLLAWPGFPGRALVVGVVSHAPIRLLP